MITQTFLNREIDLAKRIFLYYSEKLLDSMYLGNKNHSPWEKDCRQIYVFVAGLLSVNLIDGEVYVGSHSVGDGFVSMCGSRVREFLNYELREIVYEELIPDPINPDNPVQPPIVVINGATPQWMYYPITIETDGQTVVPLPFDISDADINSLMVVVNDHDPNSLVDPDQEGCHIIDNVLYWHDYYDLKAGDVVEIRYQKLA